jgi:serine/threonine protein kinase
MIQLCDFGYSLMSGVNADDDEARGLNPGTAPYIAPEVYAAKRRAAATLAAGERGEANEAAGDVVRKSCMLDWQGWQRADVYSLTMMVWGLFRANATPFFPNVDISDKSTRGKEKLLGELVEKGERPYLESKDKDVEQGLRPLWDKLLAHAESPLARGWSQMPTERPTAKKMLEQMRQCTLDGTLQGGSGSGDLSLLTLPSTSPLSTPSPGRPPCRRASLSTGPNGSGPTATAGVARRAERARRKSVGAGRRGRPPTPQRRNLLQHSRRPATGMTKMTTCHSTSGPSSSAASAIVAVRAATRVAKTSAAARRSGGGSRSRASCPRRRAVGLRGLAAEHQRARSGTVDAAAGSQRQARPPASPRAKSVPSWATWTSDGHKKLNLTLPACACVPTV